MSTAQSIDKKPTKPDDQVDRKDVEDTNFKPKSLKFITVMIGMYMSVFLVALVRPEAPSLPLTPPFHHIPNPRNNLLTPPGPHNPRRRHPRPNKHFLLHQRHRVVRLRLPLNRSLLQSDLRAHLPTLLHQVHLPLLHSTLRSRQRCLRRCSVFCGVHCG